MKNAKVVAKVNKIDKLIELLKQNKKMSAWEIAYKIKSCDVRKIISRIRSKSDELGYTISDEWEMNEKSGIRYKVYSIRTLKKRKNK